MFIFRNPGTIDPRAFTTFGISSKETKSPIGYFGTGLKYAIAILLRHGCGITVYSGGQKYEFTVKRDKFRVDEFDFVAMNGEPLSFTTELGKNWQLWQAFRELACNAKDEGGSYEEVAHLGTPSASETVVVVTGSAFRAAWDERDKIFLNPQSKALARGIYADVHEGQSPYVYYRGVRVMTLARPSKFTYDFHDQLTLTEDRTVQSELLAFMRLRGNIENLKDSKLIEKIITAGEGYAEHEIEFGCLHISKEFDKTATKLIKSLHPNLNPTIWQNIRRKRPGEFMPDESLSLDEIDQLRLKTAVSFLLDLGFNVTRFPIIVTKELHDSTLGMAQDGKIFINYRTFSMGTKMLAGTIYEEFLHLDRGVRDETRQMQNYLIDSLMSMGERVLKRVL